MVPQVLLRHLQHLLMLPLQHLVKVPQMRLVMLHQRALVRCHVNRCDVVQTAEHSVHHSLHGPNHIHWRLLRP